MRRPVGSLWTLGFIGLCPLLVAIGAFGVDLMHVNATQSELQRACDAAALAGATQLHSYDTDDPKGDSAIKAARKIALLNGVDGRSLDDDDPKVEVDVSIPEPPSGGSGGKVRVDGTIQIRGLLSHVFGSYSQTVRSTAVAGAGTSVTTLGGDQAFPIVISMDAKHKDLSDVPNDWFDIGKTFQIDFEGDEHSNGGYTTFFRPATDTAYLKQCMDMGLGLTKPVDGTMPPLKVGDQIYITNGNKDLSGTPNKWEGPIHAYEMNMEGVIKSKGPMVTVPIISGKLTPGKAGQPTAIPDGEMRTVLGFITLQLNGVSVNGQVNGKSWVQSITGNIVKSVVKGSTDPADWSKIDPKAADSLKKNGAAKARLVQ